MTRAAVKHFKCVTDQSSTNPDLSTCVQVPALHFRELIRYVESVSREVRQAIASMPYRLDSATSATHMIAVSCMSECGVSQLDL